MRGGYVLLFFIFSIFAYSQKPIEDVKEVYFVDDRNWKDFIENENLQPDYVDVETTDMEKLDMIFKKYFAAKRLRYKMPNNTLYGLVVADTGSFNIRLSSNVIGVYNENERYYYFIDNPDDRNWLKKFSEKIRSKFKDAVK